MIFQPLHLEILPEDESLTVRTIGKEFITPQFGPFQIQLVPKSWMRTPIVSMCVHSSPTKATLQGRPTAYWLRFLNKVELSYGHISKERHILVCAVRVLRP